jgi:hypothetical protein
METVITFHGLITTILVVVVGFQYCAIRDLEEDIHDLKKK